MAACLPSVTTVTCSRSADALEWALAFIFYAAIALVIMLWLWPLTRDLRALERATQHASAIATGRFDADIGAALAGPSAGRGVSPHGGTHRRSHPLAQGHVECAVARDQDAAGAHALRDRDGAHAAIAREARASI